jgi:hypothetical protein
VKTDDVAILDSSEDGFIDMLGDFFHNALGCDEDGVVALAIESSSNLHGALKVGLQFEQAIELAVETDGKAIVGGSGDVDVAGGIFVPGSKDFAVGRGSVFLGAEFGGEGGGFGLPNPEGIALGTGGDTHAIASGSQFVDERHEPGGIPEDFVKAVKL